MNEVPWRAADFIVGSLHRSAPISARSPRKRPVSWIVKVLAKPGPSIHGEEFFQHKTSFDRSSLTRWRQRMGEDKLTALIQESLAVAAATSTRRTTSCELICATSSTPTTSPDASSLSEPSPHTSSSAKPGLHSQKDLKSARSSKRRD